MLEAVFGLFAILGGGSYIANGDFPHKFAGVVPVLMFLIPFGLIRIGEPLGFGLYVGVTGLAALLGGLLFQRGRTEKMRRVAEGSDE